MPVSFRPLPRVTPMAAIACLILAARPPVTIAQTPTLQDGRMPRQGEIWFELIPSLVFWSDQFALDSDVVEDGQREPLTADFAGPIDARLYPNALPFLADINSDADALGYDPLAPDDLSFGDLDYKEIANRVIVLPLGLKVGILDRLSLDVLVPLVQTRSESFFGYDTTTATVTAGMNVVPDPTTFFGEVETAQTQLADLIASGTLTPEEMAAAEALLANSTSFSQALARRVMEDLFVPTGGTAAGMQMSATYAAFVAGYETFGLALPALDVPLSAVGSDLDALFTSSELDADPPGTVTRGLSVGELEVGLRVGIFDTFTPITYFEEPAPVSPEPVEEPVPDEAPEEEAGEQPEERPPIELGETVRRLARRPPTVQFRTTVGAKYRLPLTDPNGAPYLDPSNFLDIPVGDGQRDIELSFFQDVRVGRVFLVMASAYYGIQLKDEVDLRVNPPDQPFALASALSTVERKLGNYVVARLAPQALINNSLAIGVEYNYWDKGSDEYTLISGGAPSADPLEVETSERRHMLGVGAYYRTQDLWEDGRTSLPIEVALVYQTSIAGSGGRTPASDRFTVYLRIPARVF